MSGKRIFISDIHLGDYSRYRDPEPDHRARFFPSEHRDRRLNFLDKQIISEGDLGKFGDDLSELHGHNVVVLGPTHAAKIDKDSLFVKDRVYANSGNWCGKKAHCVVVEPDDYGKVAVLLLSIDQAGEMAADESCMLQV